MFTKKRVAAAVLPFLLVGAGSIFVAGEADAATLSCTTTTGNTGGTATCKGTGVWRIHLDCAAEQDVVGSWIRQSGGTVRQTASPTCTFKNRQTTVQRM